MYFNRSLRHQRVLIRLWSKLMSQTSFLAEIV